MKHQLRDSIIFLIHALGLDVRYRSVMRKKVPLVRVLCFHDVADAVWFENVLKMLKREFHPITPEQFKKGEFDLDRINLLLTFDDGYASWVDICLPLLKAYGMRGMFFLNSGLLDVAEEAPLVADYMERRLLISPKRPLTWEHAKALLAQGHTIGGHTVSHKNLALLGEEEMKKEIEEDKKKLELNLGIVLEDFAYPFGKKNNINKEIFGVALEAGYTFTYTTTSGFVAKQCMHDVPRICLEKNQKVNKIRIWVEGGYDIFQMVSF